MKKRNIAIAVVCLGNIVFGQGSLTPPGAPAPTMKTLREIEPRSSVFFAPTVLTEPGSYYLEGNLTGTVTFAADNISLDLMGFSITSASGNAIDMAGAKKNIWIHNGTLSAPAQNGIDFSISQAGANGLIENLRVSDCLYYGVAVGSGMVVRNVQVKGAGEAAIIVGGDSRVQDCSATGSGKGLEVYGSGALVENNRIWGNTDNYALSAGNQLNLLLCEVPETLDWPCSVKFAGTLTCTNTATNALTVAADNVTIDMAGHALIGPGENSGGGIHQVYDHRSLAVFNGMVSGFKNPDDSQAAGLALVGENAHIYNMQLIDNSCGIYIFSSSGGGDRHFRVSGCTANHNQKRGIFVHGSAIISDCLAYENGTDGFYLSAGEISGCMARENGEAGFVVSWGTISACSATDNKNGIVSDNSVLSGCVARANMTNGIVTGGNCTLFNCIARGNKIGINTGAGCTIRGCTAVDNYDTGISAGLYNRVSDCTATDNEIFGIVATNDCVISACSTSGNSSNGMSIAGGCLITDCSATENQHSGFVFDNNNLVKDCQSNHNALSGHGHGFHATGGKNKVQGCFSSINLGTDSCGFLFSGSDNTYIQNTGHNNTTNCDGVAGNNGGPCWNDYLTHGGSDPSAWANCFY